MRKAAVGIVGVALVLAMSCVTQFVDPEPVIAAFPTVDASIPANAQLVIHGAESAVLFLDDVEVDDFEGEVLSSVNSTSVPVARVFRPALEGVASVSVRASCSDCTPAETLFEWPVSEVSDGVAPIFPDPGITVRTCRLGSRFKVSFRVPTFEDDRLLLRLRGDDFDLIVPDVISPQFPVASLVVDPQQGLCFDALVFDAAGNETILDAGLCVGLVSEAPACE